MTAPQLAMDLGSAMDVGDGVGVNVGLDLNVHNPLDTIDNQIPLTDVEDLFGDPLSMQQMQQLQGPTVSKRLLQRLDELRSRGCCQGIAWSRQGTIASIAPDGRSINFQFIRCHPQSGVWELSQTTPCLGLTPTLPGCPIVHLAWAPTQSPELAVIDSVGRIFILTFSITLNRSYVARKWDNDAADDLNAVVGCYWLPILMHSKNGWHLSYGPAVRAGDGKAYEYKSTVAPRPKPFHPNAGKSAFLCVTANGTLKLFYSQNNNRIEETSLELESVNWSEDIITHASIISDRTDPKDGGGGFLHIALATASKQLKLVRVDIDWGVSEQDKKQRDKQIPASMVLNPTMTVTRVAMTSWYEHGPSPSRLDMAMTQLSHIEIFPFAPDSRSSSHPHQSAHWSPPLVLTVRSYVTDQSTSFSHEQESIVDRWELQDHQQKLHPVFSQLGHGSAGSLPSVGRLRKLEPLILPKIIVSVHVVELGNVICFVFNDGTLQYRDRHTFAEVYTGVDLKNIRSPIGAGFQFTEETPCLQTAFSPTACSFVQICEDDKVKWNCPKYSSEDAVGSSPQDSLYSAIVTALTIPLSSATIYGGYLDDILALARPFGLKHERFAADWITELAQLVKVQMDWSSEAADKDSLIRNEKLHVCFTILYHLGFHGEYEPRSFSSKFAMLALNIRNCDILISVASYTPANLKYTLNPMDEPEVVEVLAGCAKWYLELIAYLTNALFDLRNEPTFLEMLNNPRRFADLAQYLQSEKNVALHLMLCSSTRTLIAMACRQCKQLEGLSHRAMEFYEKKMAMHLATDPAGAAAMRGPNSLFDAYQKMHQHSSNSLVKLADFERLVQFLAHEIRSAYDSSMLGLSVQGKQSSNIQQGQQGAKDKNDPVKRALEECEMNMLLGKQPPPSFQKVLVNFFKQVDLYWSQMNPLKLWEADYPLLEMEEGQKQLAKLKAKHFYVDVFQRCELNASDRIGMTDETPTASLTPEVLDKQWRRCVRCAAVMQNISTGNKPGFTFVLGQQRRCACGGFWGLLHPGQMVS